MADKPIIFSAPMVRALLDGAKTQTRRVLDNKRAVMRDRCDALDCVRIHVGDRLWVREAFWTCDDCGHRNMCEGGANHSGHVGRWCCASCDDLLPKAKTSPIFMPRWASRLTLTVTDVLVQRLQEISEADARAEGIQPNGRGWWTGAEGQAGDTPRAAYALLWDSLHGHGSWEANPWAAAYTFTVQRRNIDQLEAPHA